VVGAIRGASGQDVPRPVGHQHDRGEIDEGENAQHGGLPVSAEFSPVTGWVPLHYARAAAEPAGGRIAFALAGKTKSRRHSRRRQSRLATQAKINRYCDDFFPFVFIETCGFAWRCFFKR
jgi:hypothetical protein